ncbi:MAG: hypothetical protein SFV21_07615 [Rhodospirillaceae bacterium]|nr:hypothetical protein [Rhodospirillaceae bacterium]
MSLPARLSQVQASDPIRISGFPSDSPDNRDLAACFGAFLRRIVPTTQAYVAARTAAQTVAERLRAELYPRGSLAAGQIDHVVVGGVGKRISIAPIRVIDLLYVLPARLRPTKSADALKTVWAVLRQSYPDAATAHDRTGVLVSTEAGQVRVMPSVPHEGGFLVPGTATLERASGWSLTNPVAEAATLRLADSLYNGRPRLLLAALKAWRDHAAVPVSSFALELLVQDFYTGAPRPFALGKALLDFWAWARKRTPATLRPPGALTALAIDGAWHAKAKAAYWRVTLADHHADQGKMVDAALEWRAVLGEAFPVPGDGRGALPLFPDRRARA